MSPSTTRAAEEVPSPAATKEECFEIVKKQQYIIPRHGKCFATISEHWEWESINNG
jgi:hypothetical protein